MNDIILTFKNGMTFVISLLNVDFNGKINESSVRSSDMTPRSPNLQIVIRELTIEVTYCQYRHIVQLIRHRIVISYSYGEGY